MAILIFFGVKEMPRGQAEPELAEIENLGKYEFNWRVAKGLFHKRSLQLIFAQGFFGQFPWQVITFWFFRYLEKERGFSSDQVLVTMVIAVLVLAVGYPLAGSLGDTLFKHTLRGRMIVSSFGVLIGTILLYFTMNIPLSQTFLFTVMLSLTALFIPFASPNVVATIYDVTLPEVRSTSNAVESFIELAGAAVAPALAGLIATNSSLKDAILIICSSTWVLCFLFFLGAIYFVPGDIKILHQQLQMRAAQEQGGSIINPVEPRLVEGG
jgi:MFS family permease